MRAWYTKGRFQLARGRVSCIAVSSAGTLGCSGAFGGRTWSWGREAGHNVMRVDGDKSEARHGDDDDGGEQCQMGRPHEAQRVPTLWRFFSLCTRCFLMIKTVRTHTIQS